MDTIIAPAPFKLVFPGDLTFEPEYTVPVSPNYTAHIYRQDRTQSNWHEDTLCTETTEAFYVVVLHNETGEPPSDYEIGRWEDSEFEVTIEVRRLARAIRSIEEQRAHEAAPF